LERKSFSTGNWGKIYMENNSWIPRFLIVAVVVLVFILAGIAPAKTTQWMIVNPETFVASKDVSWLVLLRDTSVDGVYLVRYKALGCPRWEIGMRNEWLESVGLSRVY